MLRVLFLILIIAAGVRVFAAEAKLRRFEWNNTIVFNYAGLASLVQSADTLEQVESLKAAAIARGNSEAIFWRVLEHIADPVAREAYGQHFAVTHPLFGTFANVRAANPRYLSILQKFSDQGVSDETIKDILSDFPTATDSAVEQITQLIESYQIQLDAYFLDERDRKASWLIQIGIEKARATAAYIADQTEHHAAEREQVHARFTRSANRLARPDANRFEPLAIYLKSVVRETLRPGPVPAALDGAAKFRNAGAVRRVVDRLMVSLRRTLYHGRPPNFLIDPLRTRTDQLKNNLEHWNDGFAADWKALESAVRLYERLYGSPEQAAEYRRTILDLKIGHLERQLELADQIADLGISAVRMREAIYNTGLRVRLGFPFRRACEGALSGFRAHEWEFNTRSELKNLRQQRDQMSH